uniref:Bifunctional inhibitor/plant lipid transfer protein/seed storage helical domain-containing protein n=1 Tax=Kalanchoe fedtschenkoi TaxID=63787 RepID=A0A7N0TL39_KALFE
MGSRAIIMALILMATQVRSDLSKDREQCAEQLISLATCLPYVGGDADAPTLDCCSGLETVLQKGKICLCLLVKDRDDPDLGLNINATLALNLPSACHAPANVSECPSLLHLAPNSTEAKIFYQARNSSTSGSISSAPVSSTHAPSSTGPSSVGRATSDGGSRGTITDWVSVKMAASAAFGWCLAAPILLNII